MKVHIITIGDEILIGQTIDTNSAWIAKKLNRMGAEVIQIASVTDAAQPIKEELDAALKKADVVLMTGGLGPTKDDITKKAIAEYLNTRLIFSQHTYDRIVKLFNRWEQPVMESHRQQCYMPESATLIYNKMGTAPGMWMEKDDKVIVSMPGVPYEMEYIMEQGVLPKLKEKFPGQPIAHRTILTAGVGETQLAEMAASFEDALPDHISLAYLPGLGRVKLRLTGRGDDQKQLEKQLENKKKELLKILEAHVYGEEGDSLEGNIGKILNEKNKTLGTAESCTGGYIAHTITTVPGASSYYRGSIIAYNNKVKMEILSVSETTLKKYGAVSEATVREMIRGAIRTLKTDFAIATSGIAGPTGGTEEKPVGTIWIAVGNHKTIKTKKIQLGKERLKNIEYTTYYALQMFRRFLLT